MKHCIKMQLSLIFLISAICMSRAETPTFGLTSHQAAGKYYAYPYLLDNPPALTPAPEGYEPFHMEHYGRHGSRWHIGSKFYDNSFEILSAARNDSALTDIGEATFQTIKNAKEEWSKGRSGELTEVGALQHKAIAKRMVENFPQIFTDDANVTARSSVVIRAILSMQNGLDAIRALCPQINMSTDASQADMRYINFSDKEAEAISKKAYGTILKDFKRRHSNKGEFLHKLFKSDKYINDSIAERLSGPLFYSLANSQSHSAQPWLVDSIFTEKEIYEQWLHNNAQWYLQSGNTNLTNNRPPFSQTNLLNNIIASADTAMTSQRPSANLRYGHDSVVFPLAVLMGLNDLDADIDDLEQLEKIGWKDYQVVPMAANIQIIFYRKKDTKDCEDILVKVLLNEREAKLPMGNVDGPYYDWKKLREYYLDKI
ncbi:MAG: hypothetical protein NC102_02715 [Clostridium sp.]|nr:hypothetical protein [Clostridium sp.]